MEIIGWMATVLVIFGFALNAWKYFIWALIVWIIGDILWIWYDFHIDNYSHAVLSALIIFLNSRGLIKTEKVEWKKFLSTLTETLILAQKNIQQWLNRLLRRTRNS